jgi:predicted acyl esterase
MLPVTHDQTAWEDADKFCSTLCIPFDETTTKQHLMHHLQDWRLRRTPKLLRLKLHCI